MATTAQSAKVGLFKDKYNHTIDTAFNPLTLLVVNISRRCTSGSGSGRRRTTGTARTASSGVSVGNTTLLVEVSSRGNGAGPSRVNAESEPSKESVADAVAEKSVLHEGIDTIGLDFLTQNTVILVESKFLGVGSIGLESFDL